MGKAAYARPSSEEFHGGMSASPLERVTPAITTLGRRESPPAAEGARTSQRSFRPLFGVLTAFWIYVALSNLMYAISMQASLTVQNIHNVFAPWDARVIQHVLLYPLFILSMRVLAAAASGRYSEC